MKAESLRCKLTNSAAGPARNYLQQDFEPSKLVPADYYRGMSGTAGNGYAQIRRKQYR